MNHHSSIPWELVKYDEFQALSQGLICSFNKTWGGRDQCWMCIARGSPKAKGVSPNKDISILVK